MINFHVIYKPNSEKKSLENYFKKFRSIFEKIALWSSLNQSLLSLHEISKLLVSPFELERDEREAQKIHFLLYNKTLPRMSDNVSKTAMIWRAEVDNRGDIFQSFNVSKAYAHGKYGLG